MKINAILMAAGSSSRFGSNKLLHIINKKTMFQNTLEQILSVKQGLLNNIIIVTGYTEVKEQAQNLSPQIITVENTEPQLGISKTIQLGIEAEQADAYLFLVCDQPKLKAETITDLIEGFQKSKKGIGSVSHKKRLGNPVIFSAQYKPELLDLTGDTGGKIIIQNHKADLYVLEISDPKELEDMDTPQ